VEHDHSVRGHAGSHVLQAIRLQHHERPAQREHERQRDLDDDEAVANPPVRAAHRRVAAG
jgi:hypothetical protein